MKYSRDAEEIERVFPPKPQEAEEQVPVEAGGSGQVKGGFDKVSLYFCVLLCEQDAEQRAGGRARYQDGNKPCLKWSLGRGREQADQHGGGWLGGMDSSPGSGAMSLSQLVL